MILVRFSVPREILYERSGAKPLLILEIEIPFAETVYLLFGPTVKTRKKFVNAT
jgi:hypothetical protein